MAPAVLKLAGGQGMSAVAEAGMLPAPAPPVWYALRGPSKGDLLPQVPTAVRGSVGIQPFSRPSWDDQWGDMTVP